MVFSEIAKYFVALFVICSPWSALPILLSLTQDRTHAEKKQISILAAFAVGVILTVVTWVGSPALDFLGIRVPSFQFAGGFVLLLLALSMLRAELSPIKQTTEDQKAAKQKESIAIVPLAIPVLAGPGAISSVIVTSNNFPGILDHLYMTICAMLVALVLGIILCFAVPLEKILGPTGINIVSRISGLILAALAVESLAKGLVGLFPVLGC